MKIARLAPRYAFLALLVIGVAVVVNLTVDLPLAAPIAPARTPTPTAEPTPPPLPTRTPLALASPVSAVARASQTDDCPVAPQPRLIVQERGRVSADDPRPLRLRERPDTGSRILVQIRVHEQFLVLEGPVCDNSYLWYRVRYRAYEGWIAEGEPGLYYVEPYLPG